MYKKVYIEITNTCNLSCDFCIKNKRNNKFMSINEFEIILKKLKGLTNYLYFHILGEPLLHPKINELIDLATSYGYKINITTNGYLIDKIIDNKNINMINISLHSYNALVNLRLWVNNKYNNDIIKQINEYYHTNIKLEKYTIKKNLYLDFNKNFIWPDLNNNYYNELGKCYGLITHFGILVDGTIIPCCLDSEGIINLGNIFNDNINEVLNSNRCINMINNFKNNKKVEELCKHCKFLD